MVAILSRKIILEYKVIFSLPLGAEQQRSSYVPRCNKCGDVLIASSL